MKISVTMIFNSPAGRMMCFDEAFVRHGDDMSAVVQEVIKNKKRESSIDIELEEVFVNGKEFEL